MVVSRKTGHYRNAVLVPAANHRRQLIPTVRYPQCSRLAGDEPGERLVKLPGVRAYTVGILRRQKQQWVPPTPTQMVASGWS